MKANHVWTAALLLCVGFVPRLVAEEARPAAEPDYRVEKDLVYSKAGDKELLLDAYVPPGEGPFPAVLVVHGGSWKRGNKAQLAVYAKSLVERKYVAFAINYRLAPTDKFPAQIDDCRAAVKWIRGNAARYRVDPARLGAIGYSAGGHLVALLGTTGKLEEGDAGKIDTRIQCVVAGGAPCDFRQIPEELPYFGYFLGGSRKEVPDQYLNASPLAFVSATSAPMFFFNSTTDELVKPESAKAMVEALQAAKVPADIYVAEKGYNHVQNALDADALKQAWEFFDKHLAAKAVATGPQN